MVEVWTEKIEKKEVSEVSPEEQNDRDRLISKPSSGHVCRQSHLESKPPSLSL